MDTNQIVLTGLPLCPTENSLYPTFRGRRIKSKELLIFQRAINIWKLTNRSQALKARDFCQFWVQKGYFLKVSALVFFKSSKIFSKDGRVKQLDASNRLKALHDALSSQVLFVDDRFFWSVSIEKVVGQVEGITVTIEPISCQFFDTGPVTHRLESVLADP